MHVPDRVLLYLLVVAVSNLSLNNWQVVTSGRLYRDILSVYQGGFLMGIAALTATNSSIGGYQGSLLSN